MNSVSIEDRDNLLTVGLSYFSIKAIYDTDRRSGSPLVSKSGYPMIMVVLVVTDSTGMTGTIYDNISSNVSWKLEGIKKACGIKEEIYSQDIEAFNKNVLQGRGGYCSTVINKSQLYPDRMAIASYLPPDFHLIAKEDISNFAELRKSKSPVSSRYTENRPTVKFDASRSNKFSECEQSQSPDIKIDFNDDDVPF